MFTLVHDMLSRLDIRVCESVDVASRSERHEAVPRELSAGAAKKVLEFIVPDGQLWSHQADALSWLLSHKNVVVSTGTASGKSLIFQFYALHRLLDDPSSKALILYPLRALTNDQLSTWKSMAKLSGLGEAAVGLIYGGIDMDERDKIVAESRIVLMTPDVCQAWLMRRLDSPIVSSFVESLVLMVIDEAHVYESVFGSNAAYLFRRLLAAKRRLSPRGTPRNQLQIIAATATIENPAEHMANLTGAEFSVVDDTMNGAPRSERQILHVEGPASGAGGEAVIEAICAGICSMEERQRFIAFVDSRQGVERIAKALGQEGVKPYRSGYETRDRNAIERALKDGTLQGVVSTSALELGIDIADMNIGVNLGVPQSRKSFRQRLGRVGRRNQGMFLVVAPANAFTKYGEGLEDYHRGSVEPSYLYLSNRFVQFAHARCLADESEALGHSVSETPAGIQWPDGFAGILTFARSGFPREFDAMAQIGADSPHFNYPLRQLGETKVAIQQGSKGFESQIGDMAYHQAIREAYPGATYLHLGTAYKVNRWTQGFNELEIKVRAVKSAALTKPILRKSVTIDLSRQGIIAERIKKGASGLIAEAQVQVNESVEGYSSWGTSYLYRELRAKDPNMRRKQRDFRTTGVVVQISDPWFSDSHVRMEVAAGLWDLLARDRSIAPQDIDFAHTNIALTTGAGVQRSITDMIVVYDSVYGGLRLTETLFDQIDRFIERFHLGAGLSHGNGLVSLETAQRLQEWSLGLSVETDDAYDPGFPTIDVPEGLMQVYKPGSIVGVYVRGELLERELGEPRFIDDPFNPGKRVLYFSFVDPINRGGTSSTPADGIVPTGHDWDWALWNPETGEIHDLEGPQ